MLNAIVRVRGTSRLVAAGFSVASEFLFRNYTLRRLYIVEVSSGQIVGTWPLSEFGAVEKLIDMRDGRHVLAVCQDQRVRCWDVVDAREEMNLPDGCPRNDVVDLAIGSSGKIIAALRGDRYDYSRAMRIEINGQPVVKINRGRFPYIITAKYLSVSPDDSILAVYVSPNRFLLLDVETPRHRKWLGSGRCGSAVCCWVPGRNQLVTYALETEPLSDMWFPRRKVPPVCWLRLYDVRRTGEGLKVQCQWQVKLADGEWQYPEFVACDGVRIVAVEPETVIEVAMDGTIMGRRALRHHFCGIGGYGRAENIWIGTLEGNLLTLADATREDHPSHERGPIVELKWMDGSTLWATRGMWGPSFYWISAYDVQRSMKIGQWRLDKDKDIRYVSLALDQERGCAWIAAGSDDVESTGIYRLRLGNPAAETVVDGPPWEGLIDKNLKVEKIGRCRIHEGNLDILVELEGSDPSLVWLSVDASGRVSPVTEVRSVHLSVEESRFLSKRGSLVTLGSANRADDLEELGIMLVLERSGKYRFYGKSYAANRSLPRACAELDPNRVVVGLREERLICFDLTSGAQTWVVPTAEGVSACDADAAGELVMVGMENGVIELRRASDGRLLLARDAHDGPVLAIAFGEDGWVATGGADGRILIWRICPK